VTCWRSVRSCRDFCRQNSAWTRHNQTQIVSGITLALAQIPESISFSLVLGVNPVLGLQSAWIMGLVTSLMGGRPGMVAGATGAVSVVLTNLVAEFGIGHLFYACMLAGALQILFGILRLGEAIRLIPHPVMVVSSCTKNVTGCHH
jgi:sulfate permease, SulP family